ncbi:SAC3 family protein A isoform X1 [Nymphaea colorata]|nr:SAC3 family protein A isoform X1 [Nymphaea colorata]XP_031505079.1 SAC3 family protein A isoform X1 [Nymphaea colorata]
MAASYNFVNKTDTESTVGSLPSISGYNHDQLTESAASRDHHDGSSATCNTSTSSLTSANESHNYANYGYYPNSTYSYGYGNTGYENYYYPYQQQGNNSYSQRVGTYQTGSYQPLNSFPNANTSVGPSSYSGTYYDPGVYQTTGECQSGGYSSQNSLWSTGTYGNYPYPSYVTPDSNGTHTSNSSGVSQPHYPQNAWPTNYYTQTVPEVSCAPGTESTAVTAAPPLSSIPGAGGYAGTNTQPPPPGTTISWKSESNFSGASVQENPAVGGNHSESWRHEAISYQNQFHANAPLYFHRPAESNQIHYDGQDQHKAACAPVPTSQHTPLQETAQGLLSPIQTTPAVDTRRASKLQIPTNPRITSFSLGMPKSEKETMTSDSATRPAYVSVSLPKNSIVTPTHDATDAALKPATFPPSLCSYVERALARCRDDSHKLASQEIMKEMITKASADGTLFTRNWDLEPLFSLPNVTNVTEKDNLQCSLNLSTISNLKKSPTRRSKSRWEPLSEEKLVEKLAQANHDQKKAVWNGFKEREALAPTAKYDPRENAWGGTKSSTEQQSLQQKSLRRPEKKQRVFENTNSAENGDNSSDSDKESGLTAYYSGAVALANSPEEKKRRENRFKRFEAVHEHGHVNKQYKPKAIGAGNSISRRASALLLAKGHEASCSRAVEDFDWDALTVKGTCQEIEKRYLRLTSAPDPATVRPEEVLVKALEMVQSSQKNYLYKCDQLKSIRQDLTVQRIRNELTVKVYETHARLALEAGDLPEFNQCQSQLKGLYAEGNYGCHLEFAAYNLLCVILHSNNNRDLSSLMSRLSPEAKNDKAVKHALAVRAAVASGNYVMFFRLYKTAPNLNSCLMGLYMEKMRFEAVRCMSRAYRPAVPVAFVARVLGFVDIVPVKGEDADGLSECEEWLRAHGASLHDDQGGELVLDTKATASSLYMPDPDDAVAHGDANLAVNDFLTRT